MIYGSYTPPPPLADYVERIWQCSDVPSHQPLRILPTGTLELVINLRDDEVRVYDSVQSDRCDRFSGAVVAGPYKECLKIDPMHHASIIGVHFKPGGAFPFIGAPADELLDMHLDLDALWGRSANDVREQLCAATFEQRFSLLENMLVSRLRRSPARHAAVRIALRMFEQTDGETSVHDVACRVGLSQRRFIRVFAAEVGLTPKLYCRVRRFQRARGLARNVEAPDWAQVAVDCGYFDQSHLIRDFQEFAGLTPASYLRQSSQQILPIQLPQTA